MIMAVDQGIKLTPELSMHIPGFVGGAIWGFAPLFLLILATVILLIREWRPPKSQVPMPETSNLQPQPKEPETVYVTAITIASGLTPQTTNPVLLIGKAARSEPRLRIILEHSHYVTGMGWSGWASPQQVEVADLRDVFAGQQIKVPIVSCSVPSQNSVSVMWGKDGTPVNTIQKGKKYRARVRFIGANGAEQASVRFMLRRTSFDEPPYIVDVTSEAEFAEWKAMMA